MSWGEQQQPSYDPNNPYGQQQPYPYGQPDPQQQPTQPVWGQPYNSGPGYTQPMPDPNNPYGQQAPQQQNPFGAPQYGQPYGQPDYGYPTPPPKKGNAAFVAILVGGLVVVGGGIAAAVIATGSHHNSPIAGPSASSSVVAQTSSTASSTPTGGSSSTSGSSSLSAPDDVDGLTLLNNSAAKKVVAVLKSNAADDTDIYPDPVYAAYNDSTGNNVTTVLVDQAIADLSAENRKEITDEGSASDVLSSFMTGAGVSDAQDEDTDATDGALSCGTSKDDQGDVSTICAWYDQTTLGFLEFYDSTTPDEAASIADYVRDAAEN